MRGGQTRHDKPSMDAYRWLRDNHLRAPEATRFDDHEVYGPVLDMIISGDYDGAVATLQLSGFKVNRER